MSRAAPSGARPRQVRLIGGRWRRSTLPVPDKPGLRPTPDRVRETLFNWLGQDLTGWRVLDAFAGSGALGFEAASRGAAEVLLIEQDAALARSLADSRARLDAQQLRVQRGDAMAWMRQAPPERFELVLLDPPFAAGLAAPAAALAARLVVPGGFVYVESGEDLAPPPGLLAHRRLRAGAVHAQLLVRPGPAATLPPPDGAATEGTAP